MNENSRQFIVSIISDAEEDIKKSRFPKWLKDIAERGECLTAQELPEYVEGNTSKGFIMFNTKTKDRKPAFLILPESAGKIITLIPYIAEEFSKAKENGQFPENKFQDVISSGITKTGKPRKNSQFSEIIKAAIAKAETDGAFFYKDEEKPEKESVYDEKINTLYSPNSLIVQDICGRLEVLNNTSMYDVTIPGKTEETSVKTYFTFDFGDVVDLGEKISILPYERLVYDAICSIYIQAIDREHAPTFTAKTIYKAMPGSGERMRDETKARIEAIVDTFESRKATIDMTEELKKRGRIDPKKLEQGKIKERFLVLREFELKKRNGETDRAWEVISKDPPILLLQAELVGNQILAIPMKWLDIYEVENGRANKHKPVQMSAERQCALAYMARRLKIMLHDQGGAKEKYQRYVKRIEQKAQKDKSPIDKERLKTLDSFKTQGNKVLFESLFSESNIPTTSREAIRRNRNFCIQVLEFWKAEGIIKSYSLSKKGKTITGYLIALPTQEV